VSPLPLGEGGAKRRVRGYARRNTTTVLSSVARAPRSNCDAAGTHRQRTSAVRVRIDHRQYVGRSGVFRGGV